jgi:hypothetical protein
MISFIMPLYGAGVKRPSIFDAALVRERLPSSNRNAGVDTRKRAERRWNGLRRGLRGAGLWYDATMAHLQRAGGDLALGVESRSDGIEQMFLCYARTVFCCSEG